jgi:hypothetical protein
MSSKVDHVTSYHNQQVRDAPIHAHDVAEHHGKSEHLVPHEQSRQADEHSPDDHSHEHVATVGHGIAAFGHKEIAALAHELWVARGRPEGSPDEDWFRAAETLRARAHTRTHTASA